jgi:hypothetical protein
MIHTSEIEEATKEQEKTFGEFQVRRIGSKQFDLINGGVVVETGSAAKMADTINKSYGLD